MHKVNLFICMEKVSVSNGCRMLIAAAQRGKCPHPVQCGENADISEKRENTSRIPQRYCAGYFFVHKETGRQGITLRAILTTEAASIAR